MINFIPYILLFGLGASFCTVLSRAMFYIVGYFHGLQFQETSSFKKFVNSVGFIDWVGLVPLTFLFVFGILNAYYYFW